ncbi:MAG: serine/threonine-protein kinase [Anaerolineales bacterium]
MTNHYDIRPANHIIANRYKVSKALCGGMGVIYLCEDTWHDDFPVALKTLKPQFLCDNKFRAQFLHEASIWMEMGWHPNIVQAYRMEYLSSSNEIYLVLERLPVVPGNNDPSLRSWMTRGNAISIEKTLGLLLDVTRGMKYATKKIPGLIHCDLKPENIYLDPDGHARISDFGLVSAPVNILENLSGNSIQNNHSRLRLGGTPLYMSPEQWRNRRISISSDIYSLGCIALEMLTGEYTIGGRAIKIIAEEHIRGGAIKRLWQVDLPDPLQAFLAKCLHPDPSQRFQTWETMEQELIKLHKVLLNQKIEPEKILLDVSRNTRLSLGETILSIGDAYLDIEEIQSAIKCFERARSIGQKQDHQELIARAEGNIGLAYCKINQFELAIYHFQRAIAQYWECGNIENAFLNYGNISIAYFQLGDFSRAQENISKLLSYSKQISGEKLTAFWNKSLKNAIINSGGRRSALEYLLYTLEVEEKFGCDKVSTKFLEILDQFICGIDG